MNNEFANIKFYGWRILLVSHLGLCLGIAGTTVACFSAFILPLTQEFGWSRASISFAFSLTAVTTTISGPIIGYLVDRYGARCILLISTPIYSILFSSLFALSGPIWHLYLVYFLIAVLGTPTGPLSYTRLLVIWFEKRRGFALGVALAGVGVAAATGPSLIQKIIELANWRYAYLTLGALNLIVILPVIYLVIRNTPREVGTYPDGILPEQSSTDNGQSPAPAIGYTLRECLRSTVFWKMLTMFVLMALGQACFFHLIPVLVDKGISRSGAASAASLVGVAYLSGRVFSGMLMDYFKSSRVVAVFFLCGTIGLLVLSMKAPVNVAITGALLLGLTVSTEIDILAYLCARYFGTLAFSRIYGIQYGAITLSGGIGIYLAGFSFDHFSTYNVALLSGGIITAAATILALFLGPYPNLSNTAGPPVRQQRGWRSESVIDPRPG